MERDHGVVSSEKVAQALADPLPYLIAVGSRIVLEPDGEGVARGLHHLIAAYAGVSSTTVAKAIGRRTASPPPELGTRRISSVRPSTEIVSNGLPH